MASIKVSNLTFYYEGSYDEIFKDVSFEIDSRWKLGFCGRNGRGKTTFLKLLMGEFEYRGSIKSDVTFDYFPIEVTDKAQSVLEVIAEIAPDVEEWEIHKEISMMKMHQGVAEQVFATLSSGEKTKVLLIALFLKDNNFLLIDEPTNHLDLKGRQVVANYLKRKCGFILVSHDRYLLDKCTDHTLSINKTNIEIVKGSFSSWWEQTARREQFEVMQNEKLSEEITQMEKTAKRNKYWAGSLTGVYNPTHGRCPSSREARLQKDSLRKEKQILDHIEQKKQLLKNVEVSEALEITPMELESDHVLKVANMVIRYGERIVVEDFNLNVKRGDRVTITCGNGSGKSSLLQVICVELYDYLGSVELEPNLKVSYVLQDSGFLRGSIRSFTQESFIDFDLFKTILLKLDFSEEHFEKNLADFSAGQKKKVLIAKSLAEEAHLYVWDEPLNYIDIYLRMQIEELILEYKPTIIFVEHDSDFIQKVASNIVKL